MAMLREVTVKFVQSVRLRWHGHVERTQNQTMPKQITTALLEGKGKDEDHVKNRKMKLKMM
jgi:hypothetical protein